jgi:1-aminocyclopropane-1-carboxylate deaminase/D-cysteine desulfhydrase-like pyridoxal-dependent ACC family enzyme
MKILNSTPVEAYYHNNFKYYVKREDLCTPPPGPPFSKTRGLVKVLQDLKDKGIEHVGYTETSISMAGWGVCHVCSELGMKAVIFDPQYKQTPSVLKYHRQQWRKFSPIIVPIKAGMAKVNYHISKKYLLKNYKNAEMLPLGLPFEETVIQTYLEAIKTKREIELKTVVVCVGSGTVAAGVIKGFSDKRIFGIMCRTGNVLKKRTQILTKARMVVGGFMGTDFTLIDEKWEYTERDYTPCPFPSHPYYDLKAFRWLIENIHWLKPPVLFWNVGSMPERIK